MKLIPDWKEKFPRLWSVRLGFMSALFSIVDVLINLTSVLPALESVLPPGWFAVLSGLCAVAAIAARFVQQPEMDKAIAEKKGEIP